MHTQLKDISRSVTAIVLAALVVFSSSYNTSMVILEPQSAAFKVCKNRLAIVLNKEAPTSKPSKTGNTNKTDSNNISPSSCTTSLLFAFLKANKAPEYVEHSTNYAFSQSSILTGFTNEILRPPRF